MDTQFWTATGQPQMDRDALKFYANNASNPDAANLVNIVIAVRKSEKMISTYLENFQEMVVGERLHCSIHPCAAVTGRMSISDPSLQNLPTDDRLIRGAIVAEPGEVLISSDFSQVEMRLAADFSNSRSLIETFAKADAPGGKAFFLQVAEDIFGEEIAKLDKRYGLTKNVGYGYLFGAGLDKMAKTAGVTMEQMAPVRKAFLDKYPELEIMSRQIIAEGKRNGGSVLTPTGRRLTVEPGKEYVLVNRKIQGHAAEVLKLAGTQLEAADLMQFVKLPIHDEYLASVPAEQAEEFRQAIESNMGFPTQYRVPITAEANILGERWIKR
jgi:DNA polymerase-1